MKVKIVVILYWFFVLSNIITGCRSVAELPDLVITNARLVDGTGTVLNQVTISITGERIQTITTEDLNFEEVTTINATGKTVMPGIIDSHLHLNDFELINDVGTFEDFILNVLPERFQDFLDHGVTAIKSTGNPPEILFQIRQNLIQGELPGPRLFMVGPSLTSPGGHPVSTIFRDMPELGNLFTRELSTEAEARETVRQLADQGVDAIKFVYQAGMSSSGPFHKLAPNVMTTIIDEAHNNNLPVTAHTLNFEDAIAVVEAGVDGLEHGVKDIHLPDNRLSTLMHDRSISYVPTLRIYRRPEYKVVPMANLRQLSEDGVRIVLGSDTPVGGLGKFIGSNTIEEAELMVQAGMTPEQVIMSATRNAAEHLGKLDEIGTVETGKLADLIIVDGDPLEDISALYNIEVVIKGGKVVVDNR